MVESPPREGAGRVQRLATWRKTWEKMVMAGQEVIVKYTLTATALTCTVTVHDIWAAKPVKRVRTARVTVDDLELSQVTRLAVEDSQITMATAKRISPLF